MNQRKSNISRWYLLGLAGILTAGALLASVGTTLARYRVDRETNIQFTPRTPVAVALGNLEDDTFKPTDKIAWQTETAENGGKTVYKLDFAVSNYLPENTFDAEDIVVCVRLIGSLNAWNASSDGALVLRDGVLLEDGTPRELTATVIPIPQDTSLYHTFGNGWIFQFLDEDGQELTWTLKGGELSCVEMNITIDASALNGTSLLQLQIAGERPK